MQQENEQVHEGCSSLIRKTGDVGYWAGQEPLPSIAGIAVSL